MVAGGGLKYEINLQLVLSTEIFENNCQLKSNAFDASNIIIRLSDQSLNIDINSWQFVESVFWPHIFG